MTEVTGFVIFYFGIAVCVFQVHMLI